MCVYLLSRVSLFVTLWTVVYQAPLSMAFSRQEYWSELPFQIIAKRKKKKIDSLTEEPDTL